MKNKLKTNLFQKLSRNFGLKLLAFALASILWFIVTNITDPIEKKPFRNVQVQIINENALSDEGKVYEVLENSNVISTVWVQGKSSILDKLYPEDIKATADLSEITFLNTVSIKLSSARNNSDLTFSSTNDTLRLSVEDVKRTQMVINTSVIGSPAEGYVIGNVTPSQNVVRISGPQSVVESIDHVDAVANIGNYAYTSDINTSVDLVLYDENGGEIRNNSLKLNISTINVNIAILATKDVGLYFDVKGEPAAGYVTTGTPSGSVATVKIAGKKSTLDSINTITISDDALDITEATRDFTATLNIKKMIPSGTILADSSFDGNVTVLVPIEKVVTRRYDIPASNIAVGHVPEGYTAHIIELEGASTINVAFSGIASDFNGLKAKDIVAIVDMEQLAQNDNIEEWEEGTYIGDVIFSLAEDKYRPTEKYKLTVELVADTE